MAFIRVPPVISVPERDKIASGDGDPLASPPGAPTYGTTPETARSSKLVPLGNSLPVGFLATSYATKVLRRPPAVGALLVSLLSEPRSRVT